MGGGFFFLAVRNRGFAALEAQVIRFTPRLLEFPSCLAR
ncbi:hypothetical protein C8N35_10380 [Breoghania corrubedonensis]|uniref:Uncharacterized protein n=1 Tax=Breoghania corrubedonensis TaxID=665038 RepID=A0A2T5VAX5_9HYPH|nr:hypothetical protein C8N35_10380 [Breoghania corrubedonensis]